MSWRSIGRRIAWALMVVALCSFGAWLVLWGYGETEMATYPLVFGIITFTIGTVLLSQTVIRPTGPRVVEHRTVVRYAQPRGPTQAYRPPQGPQAYPDFPQGGYRDMDPEHEAMMRQMMDGMSRGQIPPPDMTIINEEAYYHETVHPVERHIDEHGRFIEEVDGFTHDVDRAWEKQRRIKRRWKY